MFGSSTLLTGSGAGDGVGAGAGAGAGALVVLDNAGDGTGKLLAVLILFVIAGAEMGVYGASEAEMAPDSRETSFGGAIFPEKNSPAVIAGSAESAGG